MQQQQMKPTSTVPSITNTTTSSLASTTQGVNYPRVEHQHLTRMDANSVETDLMKLLNDFSNSRLKKYGNNNIHEKIFKKMDSVRDKQEKIARIHFEQDSRLNETKIDSDEYKSQSMRDFEELTRQLEELNHSIHELEEYNKI